MNIAISINYDPINPDYESIRAAVDFLTTLLPASIAADDNPEVGCDPNAVFGAACSTAVAETPTIARAPATSPLPPTVPLPPAPPPAPPAIPAALLPANPAPTGEQLDADGMPWNYQIHSETKSMNKDGTWRTRRGVDPHLVSVVEAQLKASMGGTPAPSADTAETQVSAPPAPPINFVELVGFVVPRTQSGLLTPADVQAACMQFGVSDWALLSSRAEIVPKVKAHLDALLASRGAS